MTGFDKNTKSLPIEVQVRLAGTVTPVTGPRFVAPCNVGAKFWDGVAVEVGASHPPISQIIRFGIDVFKFGW